VITGTKHRSGEQCKGGVDCDRASATIKQRVWNNRHRESSSRQAAGAARPRQHLQFAAHSDADAVHIHQPACTLHQVHAVPTIHITSSCQAACPWAATWYSRCAAAAPRPAPPPGVPPPRPPPARRPRCRWRLLRAQRRPRPAPAPSPAAAAAAVCGVGGCVWGGGGGMGQADRGEGRRYGVCAGRDVAGGGQVGEVCTAASCGCIKWVEAEYRWGLRLHRHMQRGVELLRRKTTLWGRTCQVLLLSTAAARVCHSLPPHACHFAGPQLPRLPHTGQLRRATWWETTTAAEAAAADT
jgi:hypothetical protein